MNTPNKSDRNFISELYKKYYINVRSMIRATCISSEPADIDECTEEVFLTALKNEELRSHPQPLGWRIVTAKNITLKFNRNFSTDKKLIRRQQNTCTEYENSFEDAVIDRVDNSGLEPDEQLAESIISTLSPDEKQLYKLRWGDNLTYEEIGEKLGITKNAVGCRIVRLTAKLRKKVNETINRGGIDL